MLQVVFVVDEFPKYIKNYDYIAYYKWSERRREKWEEEGKNRVKILQSRFKQAKK